jgi:GNAT superfamily N-acetyltransferase
MTRFEIRPARREDVPHLLDLIYELAQFESLTHLYENTPARMEAALFGPQPAAEALLVWPQEGDDQAPVAFALYFRSLSTFLGKPGLYLEDLYVQPPWRRRGIARALLQHIARIAVARDCGRFEWAVLDWNIDAQRFYESLGATILPDWRITRLSGAALQRLAQAGRDSANRC